jgi:hypothetical protein
MMKRCEVVLDALGTPLCLPCEGRCDKISVVLEDIEDLEAVKPSRVVDV